MFLSQLRASLQDKIDFAPQNTGGSVQSFNSMINEAYTQIWFERPWLFNTRDYELSTYPDLDAATALQWFTGETDLSTFPLSCLIGTPAFSILNIPGTDVNTSFYLRVTEDMLSQLLGAYITVNNRDYKIVDIEIRNSAPWDLIFHVDIPYYDVGAFGDVITSIDWSIKFKEYKLPEDLFEIQDVAYRDNRDVSSLRYGKVLAVTQREAQRFSAPYQITSAYAEAYVPGSFSGFTTYSPDFFTVVQARNALATTVFATGEYYFAWERIHLATGAALGMSEPITVDISNVDVVSLTFTANERLPIGEARRLLLGRRTNAKPHSDIKWTYAQWHYLGSNNLAQIITDPNDSVNKVNPIFWQFQQTSKILTIEQFNSLRPEGTLNNNLTFRGTDITNYIGPTIRKFITLFPRPQTANYIVADEDGRPWKQETELTVRYSYRPQELTNDYDTPLLPPEMHYLIVVRALVLAYNKFGKPAQANQMLNQYHAEIKTFANRYSSERDTKVRLQQGWGRWWNYSVEPLNISFNQRTG